MAKTDSTTKICAAQSFPSSDKWPKRIKKSFLDTIVFTKWIHSHKCISFFPAGTTVQLWCILLPLTLAQCAIYTSPTLDEALKDSPIEQQMLTVSKLEKMFIYRIFTRLKCQINLHSDSNKWKKVSHTSFICLGPCTGCVAPLASIFLNINSLHFWSSFDLYSWSIDEVWINCFGCISSTKLQGWWRRLGRFWKTRSNTNDHRSFAWNTLTQCSVTHFLLRHKELNLEKLWVGMTNKRKEINPNIPTIWNSSTLKNKYQCTVYH